MEVRRRKRGIRASRQKLEAAMIAAGFDTQAALAQHIASFEEIEKPPRDLVSKVFREQAVSIYNLTRIANALGIEAHTIYLTKDEDEFSDVVSTQLPKQSSVQVNDSYSPVEQSNTNDSQADSKQSTAPKRNLSLTISLLLAGVLVSFITLFIVVKYDFLTFSQETTVHQSAIKPPLGKVKILIQSPSEINHIASQLDEQLSNVDTISSTLTSTSNNYHLSTFEALDKWQVHAVLKLSLTKGKYYDLITANLFTQQHSAVVLQSILRNSTAEYVQTNMFANAITNIESFINGKPITPSMTNSEQASKLLLRAKNLLFSSHSVTDYQAVLDYLNDAIDLDKTFSQAYAEACRTNVRMSWIKEENSLLETASEFCKKANTLKPNDISTLTAQAELWSRSGKVELAIERLSASINKYPHDADMFAILANLYLSLENDGKKEVSSNLAEKYAIRAISLAPKHWQAFNTLGNLYFSQGLMQKAKDQFTKASKEVKHEVILANLGTLQLCFGELDNAKQTYLDTIANFENNYIGYENLGSVYLFEHNYALAIKNKIIAKEKQPEISIHQVWGGLAEAYLQNGQMKLAEQYYIEALTQIERDELLENVSLSDQLHKMYYLQKLSLLQPAAYFVEDFKQQLDTFIESRSNLGIKARSHLAWLAGEAQQTDIKQQIWSEIVQTCKVYEKSPELINQTLTSQRVEPNLM